MLKWLTTNILIAFLFLYGMSLPIQASEDKYNDKVKLKGLGLNSISLFAAGLAAPAFLQECRSHLSSKIYAGASLVYLAGEVINWSKYDDNTAINLEKLKEIQSGASTSPLNIQIESLRFAAKEKEDQYKAAKKKGSLVKIVGAAYGVAAAVALWEKAREKKQLGNNQIEATRQMATGTVGIFPYIVLPGQSANGAYHLSLPTPIVWSTCNKLDPEAEIGVYDEEGKLTADAKENSMEGFCKDSDPNMALSQCDKFRPEDAQASIVGGENNFTTLQGCLDAGRLPADCNLQFATTPTNTIISELTPTQLTEELNVCKAAPIPKSTRCVEVISFSERDVVDTGTVDVDGIDVQVIETKIEQTEVIHSGSISTGGNQIECPRGTKPRREVIETDVFFGSITWSHVIWSCVNTSSSNIGNNFDSYITFSEKIDAIENKKNQSMNLDEYNYLKQFTSQKDLINNDWEKPLNAVVNSLSDILLPKAQAFDLSSIGLIGGVGALFLQTFSQKSILGKTIRTWDGNNRAILFGAHAALALLTSSQIKNGASKLKEESEIYTALANKLEDGANNVDVGTDEDSDEFDDTSDTDGSNDTNDNVNLVDSDGNTNALNGDVPPNQAGRGFLPGTGGLSTANSINCFSGNGLIVSDAKCNCLKSNTCKTSQIKSSSIPFQNASPIFKSAVAFNKVEENIYNGNIGAAIIKQNELEGLAPAVASTKNNLEKYLNDIRTNEGKNAIDYKGAIAKTVDDIKLAASATLARLPLGVRKKFSNIQRNNSKYLGKVSKNVNAKFNLKSKKISNYKKNNKNKKKSKYKNYGFQVSRNNEANIPEVKTERNLAAYKDSSNQVIDNTDISIFRIITNRYIKSGIPKLLE